MPQPQADDGTPLKAKEGIVLDRNGTPLTRPPHARWGEAGPGGRVFVYRVGGKGGFLGPLLMVPLLVGGLALALTAVGGFAALVLIIWAVFLLRRLFLRLRF